MRSCCLRFVLELLDSLEGKKALHLLLKLLKYEFVTRYLLQSIVLRMK